MRISASTKLSEVVIRGGTLLEDFCERLKKGDNVVVRIAREDRGKNPDENYFIARLLEKCISFRRVERMEPTGSMQDGMLPKFNGTIFLNATNVEVGFISLGRNKKCHVEPLFGD